MEPNDLLVTTSMRQGGGCKRFDGVAYVFNAEIANTLGQLMAPIALRPN